MYTIELTLKHTAMPLSVQKKDQEEADRLYASIVDTLTQQTPALLTLSCDQQPHKQLAVLSGEVAAVQIFEKTSTATASGRPPGFFAVSSDS